MKTESLKKCQKDHPQQSNSPHLRDEGMVLDMKIDRFNSPSKKITERKNPHDHLIICRKWLWKNPAPLHYKNSWEIRDTKDTHEKKGKQFA